jgi:hypothetical protein
VGQVLSCFGPAEGVIRGCGCCRRGGCRLWQCACGETAGRGLHCRRGRVCACLCWTAACFAAGVALLFVMYMGGMACARC